MNLNDIMVGVGDALRTIDGLNVSDYVADRVTVPAAIVGFPETVDYDYTMQRASDHLTLTVHVLVSRANDVGARDALVDYISTDGDKSIKTAIEADPTLGGSALATRVESVEVSAITVGTVDYVAASFHLDMVA